MTALLEVKDLRPFNGVLLVFDSCRFDTAWKAKTPNLDSIGRLMCADSLDTYTPASHTSMFLGHLPSVPDGITPYYCESVRQPWRMVTGPARDANKGCGILFEGNNIIEGYRKLGFYVQGIGGVSQFSNGSYMRTAFPWSNFKYYGENMDEEPLIKRSKTDFPLNHVDEIVGMLAKHKKFTLIINMNPTHYPYDCGGEIVEKIQKDAFPLLKQALNRRSYKADKKVLKGLLPFADDLHQMQIKALENIDQKLGDLFEGLRTFNQSTYIFACADHGESFGENNLWGHMHPTVECTSVPLWMGLL